MFSFFIDLYRNFKRNEERKTTTSDDNMYFDMISYKKFKKFGIKNINLNRFLFYLVYFLEIIITIIFLPMMLIFILFSKKTFLKIFKQVSIILYFVFFCVFIYTIFTQNKTIISDTQVVIDIPINKNKIKSF